MKDWDAVCQAYCDYLYQNVASGIRYSKEDTLFWQKKYVSLTYGEILYPSLMRLLLDMAPKEDDVLLDCGSGVAKAAIALFLQSKFKSVIGVEACLPLHQQAQAVEHTLREQCPQWYKQNDLLLQHGNFLSYFNKDVTIMYTCSTCFSESLLAQMGLWMEDFPSLRKIYSLKPLPSLRQFALSKTLVIECTWDSSPCYVYQKK